MMKQCEDLTIAFILISVYDTQRMDIAAITEQFNLAAKEYDAARRKLIPCFDAFYDESTRLLANMPEPRIITDLGAGTGLLSMCWYRHFPNAHYYLLDSAKAMLQQARRRFDSLPGCFFVQADYTVASYLGAELIISALSIHHLENSEKLRLFKRIYAELPSGGSFVNYDQFCEDTREHTESVHQEWLHFIMNSGLTDEEMMHWKKRSLLDRECSVHQEILMLRQSGFASVKLIFKCGKFAVIQAVK